MSTLLAAGAGLMWAFAFVAPALLPDYSPALLSFGRYTVFGLISLPIALADRSALAQLTSRDWLEATKLGVVGNVVYYCCLAFGIQLAGAPLCALVTGTLPVVIAVISNYRDGQRDGRMPLRRMLPSLGLIAGGFAVAHQAELAQASASHSANARSTVGLGFAMLAVATWTWYALCNADWLREQPNRNARAWTTAQGVATLPLALVGLLTLSLWEATSRVPHAGGTLGPTPWTFIGSMVVLGVFSSWLASLCWNEASKRLPTRLAAQLIAFETVAALAYSFVLRGQLPEKGVVFGSALLLLGVSLALRLSTVPPPKGGQISNTEVESNGVS